MDRELGIERRELARYVYVRCRLFFSWIEEN